MTTQADVERKARVDARDAVAELVRVAEEILGYEPLTRDNLDALKLAVDRVKDVAL